MPIHQQHPNHLLSFQSSRGTQRPIEDMSTNCPQINAISASSLSSETEATEITVTVTAPPIASEPASEPVPTSSLPVLLPTKEKQSSGSSNSLSGVSSSATAVTQTGGSDAQNSDPEPFLGDVEQYLQKQHHFLQSNRRVQGKAILKRCQLPVELGLSLHPRLFESDVSSSSSLRESSEFETDDDKGILGCSSDSNDTDSILDDAVELDRRSRRKRSMQRLVAKNKMLKSSLSQAKADLAAERHSRAMIDQIYLKIKKALNSKLEAEEIKVANLKAELEQMSQEMKELKEKSVSSTSYRIGYDSSPYSLSSGLGGLMLHHSNLVDSQDDSDEFMFSSEYDRTSSSSSKTPTLLGSSLSSPPEPLDEDEEEGKDEIVLPSVRWRTNVDEIVVEANNDSASEDKERERLLSMPSNVFAPEARAVATTSADEDSDNDVDDDDEEYDAPRTMMEMLVKKQQSRTPEDDVLDLPADVDETFDSMAHKFLHQALCAKFTPARTILQLDDLLLKYDAHPENLVLVLAQEFMKWWENERSEAGGPATGGWGVGTVLMETGERVSSKMAIETRFKAIYVPLLLNYVASHQEQMILLEKIEQNAKTNDKLMRNHVSQLMALYKFDVLEADAILEWWKLLKESEEAVDHGDGLRNMSSKFVAWLEEEEDDSDDDDDESDEEDESDCEDEVDCEFDDDFGSGGKIIGLDMLGSSHGGDLLKSLDEDLAKAEAEKEELLVIGSDDENAMDEGLSTTSSLERIEECERKRRISFCTNNVYINGDGQIRVDSAPSVDGQKRKSQCPSMQGESEDEDDVPY
ncbi:hypothetical protein BGX28_008459 [Mortierella sp. GBA30]|nr:hypothetical protein BGX28_008459 [Mortierella sp. GBA30]